MSTINSFVLVKARFQNGGGLSEENLMNIVTVSKECYPCFDVQLSLHYKWTTRVQCKYGGLKSRHEQAINSPLSIWEHKRSLDG
jgi:hypothetical protein